MLATFVLNSHMKNHPTMRKADAETANNHLENVLLDETHIKKNDMSKVLPQELLKKYIIYAKKFCHPRLNDIDKEKVTNFYADIRKQSSVVGGIPIAVRHIESVLRMSEAYAKMHLRDYVRSDDIDFAIEMLLESFLQSQKVSVQRVLIKKFDRYLHRSTEQN